MFEEIELQHLSAGDQTELRAFEKFFESDGWKDLEKNLQEQIEQERDRVILASSWDENRIATGRLVAYHGVKNYPAAIASRFSSIAESASLGGLQEVRDEELEHE